MNASHVLQSLLVWVTALPVVAGELHDAAKLGDLTTIERLLKNGQAVDEVDPQVDVTAWQVACYHGRQEAAELLVRAGANTGRRFPDPDMAMKMTLLPRVEVGGPGFAVLVSIGGAVHLENGYGMADIGQRRSITRDTVFRIGSVTKQFTATAVLLCEQDGKLRTSDPLTKFFPGFPGGDKITVQHLLNHTSGLKNYTSLPGFMENVTQPRTPEEVVATFRGLSPDFEPGSDFAYCNSGYFLLGEVVRRASGEWYDDLLQRRDFVPEGMFSTGAHRPQLALANEALGYAWKEGRWERAVDWHMSQAGGAGELYATIGDLYRWNEAVFNGRVLKPETLAKAHQPAVLPVKPGEAEGRGGDPTAGLAGKYACGWLVDEERGMKRISHSGGLHGFSSIVCRYPQRNLTVVVLSNSMEPINGLTVGAVAEMAARQYLWREMNPQGCFREMPLPEGVKLADYGGAFDFGGLGVMRFRVKEGRLESRLADQVWAPVRYSGKDEFRNDGVDATFAFQRDDKGAMARVKLRQHGLTLEGERFAEPEVGALAPEALGALAGTYELPFGKIDFRLDARSGELKGRVGEQQEFAYFPVKGDEARFFCRAVRVEVLFVREGEDKKGPVTGMILQQGGMMVPGRKVGYSVEQ